jgi:hypothetical protein
MAKPDAVAQDDLRARRLRVGRRLLTRRNAEVSALMRVGARVRLSMKEAVVSGAVIKALAFGGKAGATGSSPPFTHRGVEILGEPPQVGGS